MGNRNGAPFGEQQFVCSKCSTPEREKKKEAVFAMDFAGGIFKLVSGCMFFKHITKKSSLKKGSFTVEASILMIFVLISVFLCIYYGFYLHDKIILEETVWKTALRSSQWITECSRLEDGVFDWEILQEKGLLWRLSGGIGEETRIREYVGSMTEGELLVCDEPQFQAVLQSDSVTILYSAKVHLPGFCQLPGWEVVQDISGSVTVNAAEQEEFIRLVRGIIGDRKLLD